MQYGFQGWNAKMPGKYRNLLFGIGAEEFGHVEMLAVMIAQLIEDAPATDTESAVESDPVMAAVMGQTDVQHAMGAGAGARAVDSNGYHMTDDHGVRDLLSFLLARDTMHQNQWIAAAAQLREEGHEDLPVPSNFPQKKEATDYSYQYLNFSDGAAASEGSWASGPTPDGKGEFSYHDGSTSSAPMPAPPVKVDPRLYGTTPNPNPVEKVTAKVKDVLGS